MSNAVPTSTPLPAGRGDAASLAQLEARALAQPDHPAMRGCGMTYGQLLDHCLMLCGYMQQRFGLRAGDAVLVMLEPGPRREIAELAVARCEARLVMAEAEQSAAHVAGMARADGACVAIAEAASLPALAPLLDDGTLRGCIVAGAAGTHQRVHDFAGAVAAGIAPMPR